MTNRYLPSGLLPVAVMKCKDISPLCKLIYVSILEAMNTGETLSISYLAEAVGTSSRNAKVAFNTLVRKKFIGATEDGGFVLTVNEYFESTPEHAAQVIVEDDNPIDRKAA